MGCRRGRRPPLRVTPGRWSRPSGARPSSRAATWTTPRPARTAARCRPPRLWTPARRPRRGPSGRRCMRRPGIRRARRLDPPRRAGKSLSFSLKYFLFASTYSICVPHSTSSTTCNMHMHMLHMYMCMCMSCACTCTCHVHVHVTGDMCVCMCMHPNLVPVCIWQHRLLPLAANVEAGTYGGVILTAVRPACAFRFTVCDLPLRPRTENQRGHSITLFATRARIKRGPFLPCSARGCRKTKECKLYRSPYFTPRKRPWGVSSRGEPNRFLDVLS